MLTVQTIDGVAVSGQTFTYVANRALYKYKPSGLGRGRHTLAFTAGADPTTHTVEFTI